MKRLSLYWKTWMITAITILITALLFFTVLMMFTKTFLDMAQESKFEQMSSDVFRSIEEKGVITPIGQSELDKSAIKGLSVFVFENDEMVYPQWGEDIIFTVTDDDNVIGTFNEEEARLIENEEQAKETEDSGTLVSEETGGNWLESAGVTSFLFGQDLFFIEDDSLRERKNVVYQGITYDVVVSYPITMSDEDVKVVFNAIIPYFIVIGLFVASVAAVVYAKYFSKKISNLNKIINKMAKREYPLITANDGSLVFTNEKGDELQLLENNLNQMYFKLDEALESLNKEIDVVKRLEADRQLFMRGAVHELKTPIMSMSTAINARMEQVPTDESREEYLHESYAKLQSMTRLVNEILDISKLESIRSVGVTSVNETLKETIELYDYMMKDKEIQFQLEEKANVDIKISNRNLKKILSNLLGNAVKYVPEQGLIRIKVTDKYLIIQNDMDKEMVMDESKIFQPFTTYDRICEHDYEKGHGLGLYIVDAILGHYDCKYQCYIIEDTFTFKLYF